jgi:lipid II:glycine glycyltransferase (peptidoglycan interpeptide bridge formation enzyme)
MRRVDRIVITSQNQVQLAAQAKIKKIPIFGFGVVDIVWGPLCHPTTWFDPDEIALLLSVLKREYLKSTKVQMRIEPRGHVDETLNKAIVCALENNGFQRKETFREYRTIVLDLWKSLDTLRANFHPKWRAELVSAEKTKLTVSYGRDLTYFDRFMVIYDAMWSKKRFPTGVRVGWVRRMFYHNDHNLHVFLIQSDGADVAGAIISQSGDTGPYYLGASMPGLRDSKSPGYLLHWKIIEYLKNAGIRWYDLGGLLDQEESGVDRFKKRTNGDRVVFPGRFESLAPRGRSTPYSKLEAIFGTIRHFTKKFHYV